MEGVVEQCVVRLELRPGNEVKGFTFPSHSKDYLVLVINGVGITGMPPGSIVHEKLKKALDSSVLPTDPPEPRRIDRPAKG